MRKRKPNGTLINAVGGIFGDLLRNRSRQCSAIATAPNLSRKGIQAGRLIAVTIIDQHLAIEIPHDDAIAAGARGLHLVTECTVSIQDGRFSDTFSFSKQLYQLWLLIATRTSMLRFDASADPWQRR
ncbi:MAG: hypothetical protein HYX37_04910 [Rhizobiales bacterium]|nr:hypothetical protein [Hyphomicrobiales bacterium]